MPADILPLSTGDDEQLRRIRVVASRTEIERAYLLKRRAEEIGASEKVLRSTMHALRKERAERYGGTDAFADFGGNVCRSRHRHGHAHCRCRPYYAALFT